MKEKRKKNSASNGSGAKKQQHYRQPQKSDPVDDENALLGHISGNSRGFGFFVPDDKEGDDLFVAARDLCGAMHGDTVRVQIVGHSRGAGEARVVKIVERKNESIVGTFEPSGSGGGFVVPDDNHISRDIHVSSGRTMNAQAGQKVVVRLIGFPDGRKPEGEVTEILGMPDDQGVDILSIIRSYNLYERFPSAVLKEADAVPSEVSEETVQSERRKDYRDETIITIDGDDSKDFDDAVTVTRRGELWRLGVHIADVAEYVRAGTKLDKEALKRATSVYFCDRVLPMLPEKLSNGICSLNEGVDRLTLSVIMYFDDNGELVKHKIREGVIRSAARMTYSDVARILDGDSALCGKYAHIVPMLTDMKRLAGLLSLKRKKRGNIDFDLPESKIILDESGKAVDVQKAPHLISHSIVEEFMLAANETVAEHFMQLKVPFVYRAHAAPPVEKAETLVGFLSALGISFGAGIHAEPRDYAVLLKSVDPALSGVVSRVALRSMSKAVYQPLNIGHFGLAAPYYCHFTSPIRRYPDLMIHRIIKEYMHGGAKAVKKFESVVEEVGKISSEREKLAEQAERKVDDLKKAEYMSGKIGCVYDGIISGVTEWGIFVELESSVEGLVRTENLPGDGYVFNPALFRLDSGSNSYRLGDSVKIEVKSVSGDKVNFVLAD